MFGYLRPYEPYLYGKDDTLFKALYCGVCKSIGTNCGQISRLGLTYDIALMSAFVHNVTGRDVSIDKSSCVAHRIKKRPIAKIDEISQKLADLNTILVYYKLKDDVADEKKGGIKSFVFKGGYKKAVKRNSGFNETVKKYLSILDKYETENVDIIDQVADSSATLLAELSKEVLEDYSNECTYNLFYFVGKWVYLIDALDDYDKDVKKGSYNVFKLQYKSPSKSDLIEKNREDIEFIFKDIISNIAKNYSQIKFNFNDDLLKNVLLRGISETTVKIMNDKKGK